MTIAPTLSRRPAAVLEHPVEVAAVQTMAEALVPAIGVIGDPWDGSLPWPWRSEGTDSAYGAGVLELLALVVDRRRGPGLPRVPRHRWR